MRRSPGKFFAYYDLLFKSQSKLGRLSYDSLATRANIKDQQRFRQCVENKQTAGIVESRAALAEELDIRSIPTFIINGKLVSSALSKQRLEGLVQQALAEAGQ